MRQLKLDPGQGFKKSARVVGDVMGKFHPHGDAAIYDAMVRLAQEFAMRYCLVEGQGNFGNIDGDNAAAMRYAEARMTEVSSSCLMGLTKMRLISGQPTMVRRKSLHYYRRVFLICLPMGRKVLPLGWQHRCLTILSSLPMRHCIIKHPNASIDTLLNYVKGPDFPTRCKVTTESIGSLFNRPWWI